MTTPARAKLAKLGEPGEPGTKIAFEWRHQDAEQRRCPSCHTHATLLRKARVDLGTVQKALGHSSPEITAGTYDHSELEDERETLEARAVVRRASAAARPRRNSRPWAPVGRELRREKTKPAVPPVSRAILRAQESGRLDLNQRLHLNDD